MLLDGKVDQLLYERGDLVTGGLAFPELKARSLINPAARAAGNSPDFSSLIRAKQNSHTPETMIPRFAPPRVRAPAPIVSNRFPTRDSQYFRPCSILVDRVCQEMVFLDSFSSTPAC